MLVIVFYRQEEVATFTSMMKSAVKLDVDGVDSVNSID